MSATEDLRRLMDMRGVAWEADGYMPANVTKFTVDGITWRYLEAEKCSEDDPYCWLDTDDHITPAKVIDKVIGPASNAVTSPPLCAERPISRSSATTAMEQSCQSGLRAHGAALDWWWMKMTATEELRRMLDERGAKWHTYFVDGAVHTT